MHAFCGWFILRNAVFVRFFHVVLCSCGSFIFLDAQHSDAGFWVASSLELWATMRTAALSKLPLVFWWACVCISVVCKCYHGISGAWGMRMSSVSEYLQIVFQYGCTNLYALTVYGGGYFSTYLPTLCILRFLFL